MIFWLLRTEKNDRNTFLVEYEKRDSAYDMADFMKKINPGKEYWVLEIN